MRLRALALAVIVLSPRAASAQEWQIKPFLGLTFAGATTIVDPEEAADDRHLVIGGSVTALGEVIGLEADFGFASGFFESGEPSAVTDVERLVDRSGVTTLTGNVVIALPRRMTQYTLRPYIAAGLGLMRIRLDARALATGPVFVVTRHLVAMDIGGGATGFLSDRFGLSWDLRYVRNITGEDLGDGLTFGAPRLSFWRATMGVVLR
jgi:hypothetical protein